MVSDAAELSGESSSRTRSTKTGVVCPPGKLVHCKSRNRSGIRSSSCDVLSMTTGSKKAWSGAIKCERSTASFHSSRKYPSMRACVFLEMTGMNSAQVLICRRIF